MSVLGRRIGLGRVCEIRRWRIKIWIEMGIWSRIGEWDGRFKGEAVLVSSKGGVG